MTVQDEKKRGIMNLVDCMIYKMDKQITDREVSSCIRGIYVLEKIVEKGNEIEVTNLVQTVYYV